VAVIFAAHRLCVARIAAGANYGDGRASGAYQDIHVLHYDTEQAQ
jgi:hypothetical protein